jgi:hypothetical protein
VARRKADPCRELCKGGDGCKLFCECLDRVEGLPPCASLALAERDKLRRLIVAAAKVIGMSRPWSEQKAQIDKLRAEAARIRRAK